MLPRPRVEIPKDVGMNRLMKTFPTCRLKLETLLRVPSPIMVAPAGKDRPRIQIAHTSWVTLGGVIWVILKHLHTHRRLDITDEDVHVLTQSSSALLNLEEAIPLVVVTIQVLAGIFPEKCIAPLGRRYLQRSFAPYSRCRPHRGF